MLLERLFREYGGLEYGRVKQGDAIDASFEDGGQVVIQCPSSGYWDQGDTRSTLHSKLLQRAKKRNVKDHWFALRAYWMPKSGRLMVYQMQTPSNMIVDPPEEIISKLAHNLGIGNDIMSIDIIE